MFLAILLTTYLLTCNALPSVQGAKHVSVAWGPAWHPTTYQPGYNQTWFDNYEQPAQSSLTSHIIGLVPLTGPNWVGKNNYGTTTTASNVYANSQAIQSTSSYDFLATFHVGDFYSTYINGIRHYAYYGNGGTSTGIIDRDLATYTGAKHKFTFMWTCVHGGLNINPSGGYYYLDSNGEVVGIAYAWTQKSNMATNGYTSPDNSGVAYIGFENTSKYLTDNSEFITYNYGDFCKEFYNNILFQHRTINKSLDAASAKVMGGSSYTFASTVVYQGYADPAGTGNTCRMRVFGDGNMVLPQ